MKNQILVSGKGILKLIEAPLPQVKSHEVLIRTYYSVVSAGTETTIKKNTKMSNLLRVAYKKAELVKKLGIRKSLKTFSKVVEGYQTLGYSLVGKVVAVGKDVVGIEKGDNVVATGAAKAIHAKYVTVPNIYVTKVNDLKPDMAFAGVLTIGLNGFIKADVTIGDDVAIIGGGLIGELTASCFKFAGVKVDIIEINSKVTKRLKKSNFNVKKEFDKDYDAIVIATDTTKTYDEGADYVQLKPGHLNGAGHLNEAINDAGDGLGNVGKALTGNAHYGHFDADGRLRVDKLEGIAESIDYITRNLCDALLNTTEIGVQAVAINDPSSQFVASTYDGLEVIVDAVRDSSPVGGAHTRTWTGIIRAIGGKEKTWKDGESLRDYLGKNYTFSVRDTPTRRTIETTLTLVEDALIIWGIVECSSGGGSSGGSGGTQGPVDGGGRPPGWGYLDNTDKDIQLAKIDESSTVPAFLAADYPSQFDNQQNFRNLGPNMSKMKGQRRMPAHFRRV